MAPKRTTWRTPPCVYAVLRGRYWGQQRVIEERRNCAPSDEVSCSSSAWFTQAAQDLNDEEGL